MEKSVFTEEYATLLDLLRETRKAAGVTQVELAERVGTTQSFISKVERGEARVDVIQLRRICGAVGTDLPEFVRQLDRRLAGKKSSRRKRARNGERT